MSSGVLRISLLLFGSGFCALVYQVAWFRLLRLIFGSSTPATAAVVAIFMAGIGFGSLILGPRADRKVNPLAFYSRLEFGIALAAGASPLLVLLVRWIYITAGGSLVLGNFVGTLLRLLLATLVLGLPTFLMGGTLPAVTRAVERSTDRGRRLLGLLYGTNTIGAVLGALGTTFFSIEVLGIQRTIWVACLINLLVALYARHLARELQAPEAAIEPSGERAGESPVQTAEVSAPVGFVLTAAAVVGFAFFLMELVWYRMLAPLLGGSSYTFGIILAIALLGIGAGGLLYGAGAQKRRPTLLAFAGTCSLEALLIILPFAAGDRLAVLTQLLRDLGGMGFDGLVVSWLTITALVVLPPALVAGYQFPLLVAVLGAGARRVGREVGLTYAWNTLGAIAGSLAGGFGLVPLLSAPGAWRLVAMVLVALAVVSAMLGARLASGWRSALGPLATGLIALLLCAAPGPTAFWRHSPIGAGRMELVFEDANELRAAIDYKNRFIRWEADGRESSVALQVSDGASFIVSGKSDGHARTDAATQVMSGLLGAALHPEPRLAMIIGLGTGSTAGWLAEVASIDRVDVVELEPVILDVARDCTPVNRNVMENPKVRMFIGDAREVLISTPEIYDVIFSEPSNPYRAGIASLFTRDFYRAVSKRLTDRGIFVQWLQGYEVDGQVVRTALATLGSVFSHVESWEVHRADLLLMASNGPLDHDVQRIRKVLAQEPFRTAMNRVWGVEGAEAFYAAFIASNSLTKAIRESEGHWINTDDRPVIEFGFARNIGRSGLFRIADLRELARQKGEDLPEGLDISQLDWERVDEMRAARSVAIFGGPEIPPGTAPAAQERLEARRQYAQDRLDSTCEHWLSQETEPEAPIDVLMVGECLADRGDDRAVENAKRLAEMGRTVEADAVVARWHARHERWQEAGQQVAAAFEGYRIDPWSHPPVIERLLPIALEAARQDAETGRQIFDSARQPFAVFLMEEKRLSLLFQLARTVDFDGLCGIVLQQLEPTVPWDATFLAERLRCYQQLDHPRTGQAARDLEKFFAAAPFPLSRGLISAEEAAKTTELSGASGDT